MSQPDQKTGRRARQVVPFPVADRSEADPSAERKRDLGDWRKPVIIGTVVLLVAFGGAGLWAAMAPLDSAVVATGQIAVESHRKMVEHVDGGTVTEVLIEEGDKVQRGQLMVRLDAEEARASFRAARSQLTNAQARRARLLAERNGTDSIQFPENLRRRSDDPQVARTLAGERQQFEERRESVQAQINIQEQRIAQLNTRISGLQAQRDSVVRQTEIMQDELSGLRELMEKGYYPRIRVLQRERNLADLEGRNGKLIADISQARESIGEARARISEIRQRFREEVAANLREVETRIGELRQRVIQTRARLDRKNVLAGFSGVVHDMRVASAGAVVKPGEQILQIIPENDEIVIDAKVSPRDADLVRAGLEAEVRMTALSTTTTPVLIGEVLRVSPDRLTDPKTNEAYFTARVTVPPEELEKLGPQRLKAGMPADVMIQTGERTLLQYIWKPIADAMSRGLTEK